MEKRTYRSGIDGPGGASQENVQHPAEKEVSSGKIWSIICGQKGHKLVAKNTVFVLPRLAVFDLRAFEDETC